MIGDPHNRTGPEDSWDHPRKDPLTEKAHQIISGVHFDLCRGRRKTRVRISSEEALEQAHIVRDKISDFARNAESHLIGRWSELPSNLPAPMLMWDNRTAETSARCAGIWDVASKQPEPTTEFLWLYRSACVIADDLLVTAMSEYHMTGNKLDKMLKDTMGPDNATPPGFLKSLKIVMQAFRRAKELNRLQGRITE